MKVRNQTEQTKIAVPMTPMIDIVFQLLVFFIMTFKVVSAEGDFSVRMPEAANPGVIDSCLVPPLTLRLQANPDGTLAAMTLNEIPMAGFTTLNERIIAIIGSDRGPGSFQETSAMEIEADANLDYVNVIDAITAVSGYHDRHTGAVVKLVEKIKFSPPRQTF